MRIEFPYPGYEAIAPVDVPDANLLGVYSPRAFRDADEASVLGEAFAHPIGTPALRRMVGPEDRVLILIDDATRLTPTARILPFVLDELRAAGVTEEHIEFLQAPGTHRPMTEPELREKLGACLRPLPGARAPLPGQNRPARLRPRPGTAPASPPTACWRSATSCSASARSSPTGSRDSRAARRSRSRECRAAR